MIDTALRIIAGLGALAHLGFAWRESFGWGPGFIERAAPGWAAAAGAELPRYVAWAAPLAANMAAYNLALALGLAWVAAAGARVAGTLGVFLSLWLLIAAVAGGLTGVMTALVAQGVLGLALLAAALLAGRRG